MTHTLLRRLTFSCAAALLAGAATPAAFAEDRELAEATQFTGTVMYLTAGRRHALRRQRRPPPGRCGVGH